MENVQEWVVDEITKLEPEKVKQLGEMFDAYVGKTILLTNQFNKKEVDKDAVAKQVQDFLLTIKKQFIGNWCMVEKTTDVIKTLEEHIVSIGGDLNDVRTS